MRHVCERCNGNGWVDKWQGGFGRSDLDEWFAGNHEDEQEFMSQYMSGAYGDPCPACKGNKVVDDFVCVKCKETRLPGEDDYVWTEEAIEEIQPTEMEPGRECSDCNYDEASASEAAYFEMGDRYGWAI